MPGETTTDDPQHERLVYTYTYTSDGDNGQAPQSNTVKVTTTVEEETTPDGTKVVRKKEESQQVSKVTKIQKITRVHRHLIDPLTGELIRQDDPRYQALIAEYGEPTPTTWSDEQVVYEGNSIPTNSIITKHETSTGFSPNSSFIQQKTRLRSNDEHSPSSARSSQRSTTTTTHQHQHLNYEPQTNRMERSTYASGGDRIETGVSMTNGSKYDQRGKYSNGRPSGRIPPNHYTNGNGRNGNSQENFDHRYTGTRYNEPEHNKTNTDEKIIDYDPNDPNLVDEPYLDVENPYEGLGPGRSDNIGRALLPTAGRQSPDSIGHAPPDYGEDYGTLSRMYAPFGINDEDYHSRRRSPSIDTEFREQRWRDPDLQEVIEYLSHTSDVIKENAAAYLQHLCFNDDNIKSKTRSLNGIAYLVALLQHEKPEIQKNACGALRNLCYGKRNDENKIELKNRGGIPALIHLLRRTPYEDVRESVTAVLWNASSSPQLKGQILDEGLHVLVTNIIIPFSGWDLDVNRRLNPQGKFPAVFKNATGILRNCSSAEYDGRRKMRQCDGFIPSLLHAVNSSLQSLNEIDNKSIENCMCILRNLSYKLQEVVDPNYDRNYPAMAAASTWSVPPSQANTNGQDKTKIGCMGSKQKKTKQIYDQTGTNANNNNNQTIHPILPPREGRPVEMLWQTDVIGTYVHLLRHSSNPDTLEATAGCIQNLTACYWKPSMDLRAEVRKARGLSELVDLLRVDESDAVVNASAIALRNLAIDPKNRDVLGGWAIKELVAVLPDPSEQAINQRRHSDETLTSVLAALNEIIRTNDTNAKLLFQEGGVTKMAGIMNAKGHVYNAKVIKYTAHVLNTMYKHRSLHELYKQHGYKESDFIHHRLLNSKSLTSSPQSTLNRPRGDMGQLTYFTSKGKQINRPQRGEDYRMQKLNQSMDNLQRPYGNGTMPPYSDPHADLYATVHKNRPQQVQPTTWDQLGQISTSPDSWV
ncbi:unnamed protein product [Rotaria socialis]|uniref:Catenin delta-2 n=1 Tax=Rotaria socialis TaxID=392032 RepID=A0A821MN43_9BILA|nr:unnamed protein product [Rotaria socialis]CAF3417672.1 unnamed protein product [Rotaria socialis]CAF3469241.1 unnamed protein product [Rotaria socialis]CAF3586680.1 unnamed protein product [Rotaria socialis]CAF3669052.1 unnamed protein product [Rotaria socialis]